MSTHPVTSGIREYAHRTGVTPQAVRRAVSEGRIPVDEAGRILTNEADALLAQGRVRGPSVSPSLNEARRRKLAASVRLLDDAVSELRQSCHEPDDCKSIWLEFAREAAQSLAGLLDLAPEAATLRPAAAAELLRGRLYEIMTELSAVAATPVAADPNPDGPDLGTMTAVELATRRADLQTEHMELRRRLRMRAVLDEAAVVATAEKCISTCRQRLLGLPTAAAGHFELGLEQGLLRLRQDLADALAELAAFGLQIGDFLPAALQNTRNGVSS